MPDHRPDLDCALYGTITDDGACPACRAEDDAWIAAVIALEASDA